MSLNDRENWRLEDPHPGVSLEMITPISVRAQAVLVRSSASILRQHFLAVKGAIDMMDALDYHFENYGRARSQMREVDELIWEQFRTAEAATLRFQKQQALAPAYRSALHEAVAYLNRLGQFYKFARSEKVQGIAGAMLELPRMSALIKIRNKVTAHRAVDDPRRGESSHFHEMSAFALSRASGLHYGKVNGLTVMTYQVKVSDHEFENFCLEVDHSIIMQECYGLISAVLA